MTEMPNWLPGIRRLLWDVSGGPMIAGYPWRLVIHTTEGSDGQTVDDAHRGYSGRHSPHFTAEIRKGRTFDIAQHGPLNTASTVMDNDAGGVETNRAHTISIELLGQADRAREIFSPEGWHWLGTKLAPIFADGLIKPVSTTRDWVDATDGFVAREDAPQRMTFAEWNSFNGVCGHCHGPEDEHYDPGKIDIFLPAFFHGVASILVEPEVPETPEEEDDMSGRLVAFDDPGDKVGSAAPTAELSKDGKLLILYNGLRLMGDEDTPAFGVIRRLRGGPAVAIQKGTGVAGGKQVSGLIVIRRESPGISTGFIQRVD